MKKIITLVATLCLLTSLAACGGKATKTADLDAVMTSIQEQVELPMGQRLDDQLLKDVYGIDVKDLKQYAVVMPMMMVQATEIAMFEVADSSKVETVKAQVQKRVEALDAQWKQYLPDQYELVQKHILKVEGNYIILIVAEQADKIYDIYEKSFK